MSATESKTPVFYNSLYRHGVDEKRRVQVPAKWRQDEVVFTIILWGAKSLAGACLLVLPPAEWAVLVAKVKAMSFSDPKAEALRRLIGVDSIQVTVDRAGRICLPEPMAKAAGIEGEAVLVGLLDRFQIWNPARYDAIRAVDETLSQEAFSLI
jgi:MraZ protein